MFRAGNFRISPHIALQIHNPDFLKLPRNHLAKTIKTPRIQIGTIGHKPNHPFLANPITGPAQEPHIRVIQLGFLRIAGFEISCLNPGIGFLRHCVFIIVVLILLIGVIRRIADDNGNAPGILFPNPLLILVSNGA